MYSNNYLSKAKSVELNTVPCSLMVSEKHQVPINFMSPENESALESGHESTSVFVAPTFAEMMLDASKVQAVFAALAKQVTIIPPARSSSVFSPTVRYTLCPDFALPADQDQRLVA